MARHTSLKFDRFMTTIALINVVTVRTFLYAIFFLLLCRCKTKLHIEALIDKNMDNGE